MEVPDAKLPQGLARNPPIVGPAIMLTIILNISLELVFAFLKLDHVWPVRLK